MSELLIYGVGALLCCFTLTTFFLSRLDPDEFAQDYEFKTDPFWYILGIMSIGSFISYIIFPDMQDMVKQYNYLDILLPVFFAALIYFGYLLDSDTVANGLTFGAALIISYFQPDTFSLFPAYLSPWQDKLITAIFLFAISKGLGLLNGLAAIASMQFLAVMASALILTYFGALPQILGIIALAYGGTMLAFCFYSWPPEKLVMSNGAFSALGFIMGCFMLDASVEYAEVSMFVAASYLFTELGIILYNRYILRMIEEYTFMYASYYRISENGQYEIGVVHGLAKIFIVNIVLSMIQITAYERLAFPVFSVALNLWFLSILSGDTKPEQLISFTKLGKKAVKEAFRKPAKKSKRQKKK